MEYFHGYRGWKIGGGSWTEIPGACGGGMMLAAGAWAGRGKERMKSGSVQTGPRIMGAVGGGGMYILLREALFCAAGFARLGIAGTGQQGGRCTSVDAADADAIRQRFLHRHV